MRIQKARFPLIARLLLIILAVAAGPAAGELVAKLPQVMNPSFLAVADGRIYVVEESPAVHYYTFGAKGVSFVKTFAREGQGPGEFSYIYLVRVFKDRLDIPDAYKLARFTPEGEFVGETKFPIGVFKGGIHRLGESFLIRDVNFGGENIVTTIRLYNKDFKIIKEIGARTEPMNIEKINLVADYFSARVADDRIYIISSGRETMVTVLDRNGVRQSDVRLSLEPTKITSALKDVILKPLKEDPSRRMSWADYEKRLYFPDATPGLDYFDVIEGKFVTRTYKYREGLAEFAVFDLQGKELKRVFLPYTGRLANGNIFCFHQGRFYYLRENPEDDSWELHSEKAW